MKNTFNTTVTSQKPKLTLCNKSMLEAVKNLKLWLATNTFNIFFYAILAGAFIARIINLNYNSAFNDEAIYIVIGRMGLFASDWWSYGAKLWMAGLPYIYPTMSALAYQTGGLVASRFLNVIFGVILIEEVYRLTNLLNIFDEKTNKTAALIAAFLAAFSGIGIFVSKLATYDIPSFLLLIVGINSFLKAKYFSNGKYYFLTFLCIFLAFLTKIVVAVFFPLLALLAVFILKSRPKKHQKMALVYLVIPFLFSFLLYAYLYRDNILTYVTTHKSLGQAENYLDIPILIWTETKVLLFLLLPAIIMFIKSKKIRVLSALLALFATIPVFHLVLNRYATLDKHLYLSVIFLSVIVGYGASLIVKNKNKYIKMFSIAILPVISLLYLVNADRVLYGLEHDWKNTVALQNYLRQKIQPGDKILTEEGGAIILSLYDRIFPPKNIVTFDWINYSGLTDDKGYLLAVNDGYFDYIELDNETVGDDSLKNEILQNINANYSLIHQQDSFGVYHKK